MPFKYLILSFTLSFAVLACMDIKVENASHPMEEIAVEETTYVDSLLKEFLSHSDYYSKGFDFPVGKPDAVGYYNAQGFGKNYHLGDDWNGKGGGNTDMGDPIYTISDGLVVESVNYYGGWGNVTRVVHAWKNGDKVELRESLYAHSQEIKVKKGDWVKRGDQIATIGNAEGVYLAHLHLEIRDSIGMDVGGGYNSIQTGFLDPTKFIRSHRTIK